MRPVLHAAPARPARVLASAATALALGALPMGDAVAHCRDRAPIGWDIEVAPAGEPGERLVVTGPVLARDTRRPLPGVNVYVYHADASGQYNAAHPNAEPRLCGVLRTNANGEYRVRTRMPGGYGGEPGHVHFELWGRGIPRQHAFVNLTVGAARTPDGRSLAVMRVPWPGAREDLTATTRPARRDARGVFQCVRELVIDAGAK